MKALTGLVALLLVGVVAIGAVSAFGGFREGREDIQAALESDDYDAWVSAIEEARAYETSEERFEQMQTHYQQHEAIRAAMADCDYEEWKSLTEELDRPPKFGTLTEEDFYTLADLHDARQAGDDDLVTQLQEELGFGMGRGMGPGMGPGFGQGKRGGMHGGMRGQGFAE